jgi:hypothetical protein
MIPVVYEYVAKEFDDEQTVHLVRQESWFARRTLCGRSTEGWMLGDETLWGGIATCGTCRKRAGLKGKKEGA